MKIPLSGRLTACCSFVHPGDRVADIGCDHGYLGIYLLQQGIASHVIAADVKEMPLNNAVINAAKFGVKDKMSFYLSSGAVSIPREFDCMVCAGMGADTIISILEASSWLCDPHYRLILQCQSKRPELRRFLARNGYSILRETLAQDGKFIYTIMEVTCDSCGEPEEWEYYLSDALVHSGSPLLLPFLQRVIGGLEENAKGLSRVGGDQYAKLTDTLAKLHSIEKELSL